MDSRIFLERYRLSRGRNGLPVELYRFPAARTYRAQEVETGREVALTLVSPAPNDPALLERLEAQANAAEQINQVNIPRLYDFGREKDELIYVSEYCEGHTAAAWVAARGPLAIGAVLRVALQMVDAMSATAFQRLHHAALNPDNIIFTAGQTVEGDWPPVKVLHWFAPAPDFSETGDARIDSAVRFAAPEQVQKGEADVRSEIYSLGATMWFLLTGTPPAATVAGEGATPLGAEKLRGVPKIVRHLLNRMLRADPAQRPQDPVALAAYLQTCLARVERREKIEGRFGVPLLAKARVAAAKPRMPIPIKPLAWVAALLALAALAIVFLPWPLTQKRSAPLAEERARQPENVPNYAAGVPNDLPGRASENLRNASPAPATLISTVPARTVAENRRASIAHNAPPVEPPAPAEGPSEPATTTPATVAANSREVRPADTTLPESEPNDEALAPSPVIAETNDPDDVASAEPAPLVDEEPGKVAENTPPDEEPGKVADRTPPAKKASESSLTKSTTKPKAVASTSQRSSTPSARSRRVAHTAKRAKPLPKLRVGSAPAELVGTTSDGRWILSVSEGGERVIVPPPPGYDQ
ncbi:hypothetical protein BH18VER2_BH18VER2_11730 [soil metagenome]